MVQRVTESQNKVVITDRMWARLLSSTNQPSLMDPNSKLVLGDKIEEDTPSQLVDGDKHPKDNKNS